MHRLIYHVIVIMTSFDSFLGSKQRLSDIHFARRRYLRHDEGPITDVFIPSHLARDPNRVAKYIRDTRRVYSHGDPGRYLVTKRDRDREYRDLENVHICVFPSKEGDNDDIGSVDLDGDDEETVRKYKLRYSMQYPRFEENSASKEAPQEQEREEAPQECEDDGMGDANSNASSSGSGSSSPRKPSSPPPNFDPPPGAPELTQDMLAKIEGFQYNDQDINLPNLPPNYPKVVMKKHWDTLSGQAWIEDQIVDYYLHMIHARNGIMHPINPQKYPRVYCFGSQFYALLASRNAIDAVNDATEGVNIFEYELLFFPVCVNDHWRLVVADATFKAIGVFNSLEIEETVADDNTIREIISEYLENKWANDHYGENSKWEIGTPWVPQQIGNSTECGAFMLQFAEHLSRLEGFNFELKDMPYFRKKMMLECLEGKLLTE